MRRSHNRKLGALGTSHAEGDAGCSGEAGQDHECDRPDGTVTVRFWQLCDHNRHAAPGQTPARCCRGSRDEGEANVAKEHGSASGRRIPQEGDRGEEVCFKRRVADTRDRVWDRDGGEGVVVERTFADARDRVWDRDGGEGVALERKVADGRDRVATESVRDDEGGRTGTRAASDGRSAVIADVLKASVRERSRTARCREAHGEQEGQNGRHDSLDRHQALPTPGPCSRTAGAYLHDPLAGGVLVRCYRRRGLP